MHVWPVVGIRYDSNRSLLQTNIYSDYCKNSILRSVSYIFNNILFIFNSQKHIILVVLLIVLNELKITKKWSHSKVRLLLWKIHVYWVAKNKLALSSLFFFNKNTYSLFHFWSLHCILAIYLVSSPMYKLNSYWDIEDWIFQLKRIRSTTSKDGFENWNSEDCICNSNKILNCVSIFLVIQFFVFNCWLFSI